VCDLVLAPVALVILLPVLAVVTLLVRLSCGSPVLFRQVRPGLRCRPFTIFKFRTMTDAKTPDGNLLSDRERLTRVGRLLRRASLDELPALINVLKGEMSLVGPRPLLMHYLPYFSEREQLRHAVRPGMTGWAQVNGRNLVPWDTRLAMDVWYVENWSLRLDLRILCMTVLQALRGVGVAPDTEAVETDLALERGRRRFR
jgi:lipopolysaccharide/colanic/teichoic acid biosynthesis glycosyltransferase